ncbi:DUF4426 domain-containing protein [Marinimicrobium alkaliphilum]|uniref:DUF4426 domain-containing protein n=1 Tax=Marinimicrobium alkaliphilum TaxID=2202654 RepID=UPI000DB95CAC|nr:DUF4426 domain-containing protein [Marinimicrobium alkaliphilum]
MIRWLGLMLLALASSVHAQTDQTRYIENSQRFGDYQVHYTVFNSTFIPLEAAQAYGFTRARDRALVNISVTQRTDDGESLGLPAQISGTATNLAQQQFRLRFEEIDEGTATYYLAPLRHTDQEVMHFDIEITPEGESDAIQFRFTRTLHRGH